MWLLTQGPGLHVERGERLVHEQDLGVVDERGRESDALALAAGRLVGVTVLEGFAIDDPVFLSTELVNSRIDPSLAARRTLHDESRAAALTAARELGGGIR